ncbi:tyrosine-type recombinase/integrase [Saccharolobus islandicus]|uniref:Integrase family protein n=1 Tax=Saccharolobus islandicus (strain M.16.27) TaxID=427318 RepID=C3N5V9_SACI3|nr:site-specific integrase [Sulfolobus islandicus]ACP55384.1 integrase family protein [Sulfolobus islandicus M.16.27]
MIDVSSLTEDQKIKIVEAVLQKGISYEELGIDRVTWWRYKNKKRKIPNEIAKKAAEYLTPDELLQLTAGVDTSKIGINEAIGVIVKATKDPDFRELFLSMLQRSLGEFIKAASYSYPVTSEDLQTFKKLLEKKKAKHTFEDHWRYLNRVLKDNNYVVSLEKIKDYLLEQEEESVHRARKMAIVLKLFIKEIVKPKDPILAQILYYSFSIPQPRTKYKPSILSIDFLKRIFNEIQGIGAKTYFLLASETGLRTGELFHLTIDQIDLKHKTIRLMKENETKRAYITFLHKETAKWIEANYLPYREEYTRRFWGGPRALGQDVEKWRMKFFPMNEDKMRAEIKTAMQKVGKVFRLYDLRAFWASYMIKQGVSPMIVNILQGRTSPGQFRILQEHYLPFSEEELREIYEKYAPKLLS